MRKDVWALLASTTVLLSISACRWTDKLPMRPEAYRGDTQFARTLIERDFATLAEKCGIVVSKGGKKDKALEERSFVSPDALDFYDKLTDDDGSEKRWQQTPTIFLRNNGPQLALFSALDQQTFDALLAGGKALGTADLDRHIVKSLATKDGILTLAAPENTPANEAARLLYRQSCLMWVRSQAKAKAALPGAAAIESTLEAEAERSFRVVQYYGRFWSPLVTELEEPGIRGHRATLQFFVAYQNGLLDPSKSYYLLRSIEGFVGQTYTANKFESVGKVAANAGGSIGIAEASVEADAGFEISSMFQALVPWTVAVERLTERSFRRVPGLDDVAQAFNGVVDAADVIDQTPLGDEGTEMRFTMLLRGMGEGLCKEGAITVSNPEGKTYMTSTTSQWRPTKDGLGCEVVVAGRVGNDVSKTAIRPEIQVVVRLGKPIPSGTSSKTLERTKSVMFDQARSLSANLSAPTSTWVEDGAGWRRQHTLTVMLVGAVEELDRTRPISIQVAREAACGDGSRPVSLKGGSLVLVERGRSSFDISVVEGSPGMDAAQREAMDAMIAAGKAPACRVQMTVTIPMQGNKQHQVSLARTLVLVGPASEKGGDRMRVEQVLDAAMRAKARDQLLAPFLSESLDPE